MTRRLVGSVLAFKREPSDESRVTVPSATLFKIKNETKDLMTLAISKVVLAAISVEEPRCNLPLVVVHVRPSAVRMCSTPAGIVGLLTSLAWWLLLISVMGTPPPSVPLVLMNNPKLVSTMSHGGVGAAAVGELLGVAAGDALGDALGEAVGWMRWVAMHSSRTLDA